MTFAQSSHTYKVSGTAISFYTNQPIPYGFVHFQKNGKTKSTVCDSLGHFVMTGLSKGKYTLSFEIMKGYYYKDKDTSFSLTNNIDNFKFIAHLACANDFDEQKALDDIKSNVPKIILVSKQVFNDTFPHIILNIVDKDFQNKYGIVYSDQSIHVGYEECMLPYNLTIFKYLDKKFGIEWRKELRQDAVGSKDE